MTGRNIIIIYHYVRDDSNFKCFTTEQFRKQVEYLNTRYNIITLGDYLENSHSENTCVLTFDDGVRDGLTNCLPILEELGLKANFFIPTVTLVEEKILAPQKRHLLMAKLGDERLIEEFNKSALDYIRITSDAHVPSKFDTPRIALLKLTLDSSAVAQSILDEIFKKHFNEKEEFRKIYLHKDAKKLQDAGMELGTHGHRHIMIGTLSVESQHAEIESSVVAFNSFFNERPKYISYPFAGYDVFTIKLLKEHGFKAGLTIMEKPNYKKNLFELGRYDCATV